MTKKDKIQEKLVSIYLKSYKSNNKRNTIISATGTGKSKITMLILDEIHNDYDSILFLGNSDRIRDVTWKEELKKWDRLHLLDKAEFVNYQTSYKWTKETKDLSKTFVVCDEIDYAIGTPEYGKFFYNYPDITILGLTGYCAQSKREELNKVCPIIVEYTFEQAVKDGVINDIQFTFVRFDLDREKTIKVEYTDKKTKQRKMFYQSENDAYDYADEQFRIAYGKWEKAQVDFILGSITEKEFKELNSDMKRKRNKRIKLLYNGIASIKVVSNLQEDILQDTNNKVITFSKYTVQCDRLSKFTCHYNNSKEVNESNMSAFNSGRIKSLGVCSKIDRGENLTGLNNIILESYNSSDTIIHQRVGRGNRLDVNEKCTFYVLLPYFMRKGKDGSYKLTETQMVSWARSMFEGYDLSNAKFIDLRLVKE
jgi:superfamily II DNA or RNA helicase